MPSTMAFTIAKPQISLSLLLSSLLIVSAFVAVANASNPADELVDVLNKNRTAHKSSSLTDNPGLACIALQYIKAYEGKCEAIDDKKPADAEFAQTFAPNCGVQISTLARLTGRLLGCQSHYIGASEAFSEILTKDSRSTKIIYSKNHTEVGAAVTGTDGGSPYFWCVLFSNGSHNSSFVLDGGVAKTQRPGCFSGTKEDCSKAGQSYHSLLWAPVTGFLVAVASLAFSL